MESRREHELQKALDGARAEYRAASLEARAAAGERFRLLLEEFTALISPEESGAACSAVDHKSSKYLASGARRESVSGFMRDCQSKAAFSVRRMNAPWMDRRGESVTLSLCSCHTEPL